MMNQYLKTSYLGVQPILLAFLLLMLSYAVLQAQTYPTGFSRVTVATGLAQPVAMDFATDGRIFIAQQGGSIRIVKNNQLLPTPFVSVSVQNQGERGLLGLVLDPSFSTNGYVYVYYTLPDGSANRISRYTANGDVAVANSKLDIITFTPLDPAELIHNGGAMKFKNGLLYVAVGENAQRDPAQSLDSYLGKILRLNPNGTPATGNPFTTGSLQRRSIWVYGLRNPYTFDIDPVTGRILVNDVGGFAEEDINDCTTGGGNYGYPTDDGGDSDNPAFVDPVYSYDRVYPANDPNNSDVGCAITGGVFLSSTNCNYPSQYHGKYFFVDWCASWINFIDPATGVKTNFSKFNGPTGQAENLGIDQGPDGNLYFMNRKSISLYKVIYTNTNIPDITTQPVSLTVSEQQPASFTVTASGAAPISFKWQKNQVDIPGATGSTYTLPATLSSDAGSYRAVATNSFGSDVSNSATLTVTPFNAEPSGLILTPTVSTAYFGGATISFSGDASDPEDGTLPASAFTWDINTRHDGHTHDLFLFTNTKSGSFTIGTSGLEYYGNLTLEVNLYVRDSQGLIDTTMVTLNPLKSTISMLTDPPGLDILFDGTEFQTPLSRACIEGIEISIGATQFQMLNGISYQFDHWEHGGTISQEISIPQNDVTYTAVFVESENQAVSVQATKDAHVRDGANAGINYGAIAAMETKQDVGANSGFNREAYLAFDLAALSGVVSSAELRVYGNLGGAATIPVGVFSVPTTTWSETTLNWTNKPAAGATALASNTLTSTTGQYHTWDVTAYVAAEKAAGRNVVSFNMKNLAVTGPQTVWSSKEAQIHLNWLCQ